MHNIYKVIKYVNSSSINATKEQGIVYIQSAHNHISHHFIRKTWNKASHWFNEHTAKCRKWTRPCLMDGKIKTAGCFPKKWGNVAECSLFHKAVDFWKFEKRIEGRWSRTYLPFHLKWCLFKFPSTAYSLFSLNAYGDSNMTQKLGLLDNL